MSVYIGLHVVGDGFCPIDKLPYVKNEMCDFYRKEDDSCKLKSFRKEQVMK